MNKIETLLVVVDPTVDRDFVVARAKIIAQKANAKVRLFINNSNTLTDHSYIYEGVDGKFFESQRALFEEHYQDILVELAEEFSSENIEVSSKFTEHHNLAEAIINEVIKSKPDLVLKSTHHHGALRRTLVTNTDWRLIRKCPSPLLLVKPNVWQEGGSVVSAVDPMHNKAEQSDLDHYLIDSCISLSKLMEQNVRVFHSYFPFVSGLYPMSGESSDFMESTRLQHKEKLEELAASHQVAEECIHLSRGDLVPTLIDYLKAVNANVLLIGALSRNVLERAIVGNTAEKILEDCPCDVLVLKPE